MKTYKLLIVFSWFTENHGSKIPHRKEKVERVRATTEHAARRFLIDDHLRHGHQVHLISSQNV